MPRSRHNTVLIGYIWEKEKGRERVWDEWVRVTEKPKRPYLQNESENASQIFGLKMHVSMCRGDAW